VSADVPSEVVDLVARRQAARHAKDFAAADALRDEIRRAGFEVVDTPAGPTVHPAVADEKPASRIVNLLDQKTSYAASLHWIVEGWPEDVERGIDSFDRHHPSLSFEHVVVDLTGTFTPKSRKDIDVVVLPERIGWAAARNAGLQRSRGSTALVVDGSMEATGDVLSPLVTQLDDPSVGVTGPFGIVTDDLREFRESPGPDVDAIEGYLMALRREQLREGLRFDERFRFYRSADIELSFRVKDAGLRAVVTPVPVTRHEHRMWTNTPPDRRDALSKRNYYRFLERFRGRSDLTVAGSPPAEGG
jgi:Glycosyl transferase family 2